MNHCRSWYILVDHSVYSSTYSGSRTDLNFTITQSFSSNQWHESTSQLLNLTGSGKWFGERLTLSRTNTPNFYADGIAEIVSHEASVSFANGASYVPISLLSLNPGTVPSPTTQNASHVGHSLINDLISQNNISSNSWGLHVGSGAFNITGSMYLGGYDQNRVIEAPAIFSSHKLTLTSITLGTTSGLSPWSSQELQQNYLRANGSTLDTLEASADPSVPYLYLPADTCSALASVLPIKPYSDLNLYSWDTSNSTYHDMISSPSFLNLTFPDSSHQPISIRLPLSLLNLTLDAPIVTTPTPYFPCRPSSPSLSTAWALGRAFLQAAYIGRDNDADVFWLAQAPGPKLPTTDPVVKTISSTDRTIAQYPAAPKWEDTWAGVLKPLTSASSSSSPSPSTSSSSSPAPSSPQPLTPAAKAGIAIGALAAAALLCLLIFIIFRRRKRGQQSPTSLPPLKRYAAELMQPGPSNDWGYHARNKAPGAIEARHEAPGGWQPAEVEGSGIVGKWMAGQGLVEVQGSKRFGGER